MEDIGGPRAGYPGHRINLMLTVKFHHLADCQHQLMRKGQPGRPGANRVLRANGQVEELGHIGAALMEPGDVFEIATPGGGGFGECVTS